MPPRRKADNFTLAVRDVFGRWVSARKIEALRLTLIRAGIVPHDDNGQAPYEVGPPISPLHS